MRLATKEESMTCTCVETVNEKLKTRNTRLHQAFTLGAAGVGDRLMLVTEQIETGRGKEKAVGMFLSYCPFCGVKYDKEQGE
jgi:hypothetical protein